MHLISDATGETLNTVARAAAAYYADYQAVEHIYALVRTPKQLVHLPQWPPSRSAQEGPFRCLGYTPPYPMVNIL